MSALNSIKDFYRVHSGRRLFILASGPSLNTYDLSPLSRRIVMGLNRSFLCYPEAHYHCCMDLRLFDLYPDLKETTRYLFTLKGRPYGIPINLLGGEGFSLNLEEGIYTGYTISYFALQLAVYMGFSEIIYLGLDLQHKNGETHFFGKDFYSRNHESTEFPKMKRMLESGAREANSRGVICYNCSPYSELLGFKKITFENAIAL